MKGYMIFIEGGQMPTVVHRHHKAALHELHRLAAANEGKRAIMLQVQDHIRYTPHSGKENLGSHMPHGDDRSHVPVNELVRGVTLPKRPPQVKKDWITNPAVRIHKGNVDA